MGLSCNPFTEHTEDYNELVRLTPEGVFVNVTDRNRCDSLIEQFVTGLEVYPSDKMPLITEQF